MQIWPSTVTVCVHVAGFPHRSVAVQVTTVSPIGYGPAGVGTMVATPLQSSVAVAVEVLTAVQPPPAISGGPFGGHWISGAVVSCTVIGWLTCPESFPLQSTAFHVIVLVEVPGHPPSSVTSDTTTTSAAPHVSDADGGVKAGTGVPHSISKS